MTNCVLLRGSRVLLAMNARTGQVAEDEVRGFPQVGIWGLAEAEHRR